MTDTDFRERARRLRNAVEPVAAGVSSVGGGPHMGPGLTIDTADDQFTR